MQDVESRFTTIENQLKFQRIIIGGLLVALVALVGYGATEGIPDVIRARKFEVVNEEGRAVVVIQSWKYGGVINTYPAKGKYWPSVSLSHSDSGDGMLAVSSKKGKMLIYAGAAEKTTKSRKIRWGDGIVIVYDNNGDYRQGFPTN